jgi:23S rRNA (cytosine1962-C5)-methyltransferase
MGSRLAVRVTKDALRQIRGGHPWVYDSSITSEPDGAAGDLAVVFDEHRKFAAIGLYDPGSPIRIKVLHRGRPTPIDETFWRDRLVTALERRGDLVDSRDTTGYRWINGENDGMPGCIVDRFADVVVMKLYSAAWVPHLPTILELIERLAAPRSVVLRWSRNLQRDPSVGAHDGEVVAGEPIEGPVPFLEHGLTFEADVIRGQKTGFFLDQRDNRARVRSMAAGARVLDVFSASGGFSVSAAAGGARSVHSVDISPGAIEAARRNMALNAHLPEVKACQHDTTVGDAVATMQRMVDRRRTFDVVVVDPPSFASRQDQVDGALRAYGRLAGLAVRLVRPGGHLLQASCSSRVDEQRFVATVRKSAHQQHRPLLHERTYGHAVDHPIGFREGAYLKALTAEVGVA